MGNPGLLAQEITPDRQALYGQIVDIYKWTDKVHEYSSIGSTILSQNSLKRSYVNLSRAKRNKQIQTSTHNISPQ